MRNFMATFNLSENVRNFSKPIPSLVETINYFDSSIQVRCIEFPNRSEYDCLIWDNLDKPKWARSKLEEMRVKYTIDKWIISLMEHANQLQRAALALHTISVDYTLTQKTMYDIKYSASVDYIQRVAEWQQENDTTDLPTAEQVSVPVTILNEANRTNDPYYYLCLAIIKNYVDSEQTLASFYGKVEGERRVTKQRIMKCKTLEELKSVEWANWPDYEGTPPAPTD